MKFMIIYRKNRRIKNQMWTWNIYCDSSSSWWWCWSTIESGFMMNMISFILLIITISIHSHKQRMVLSFACTVKISHARQRLFKNVFFNCTKHKQHHKHSKRYFFGYRCPIWLFSSTLGSLKDLLGLICHRWLAKWWKIDHALFILVVEWGVDVIWYICLLHKTYFRSIHFYPTTLTVGEVPSDIKIDLIPSLVGWNPYSTAVKQSVLTIRYFEYLQEEIEDTKTTIL